MLWIAGASRALLKAGALVATAAGLTATQTAYAAGPCTPLVLDFAGFPAGTVLSEQLAAEGIHMSAVANEGRPDKLVVFDADATGSADPDLETAEGHLAIIPEDDIDANADGLVDEPSDSIRGGTQIYRFDQPRTVESFTIVDIDHGVPSSHYAVAFDAFGNVIKEVPIPIGTQGNVQTVVVDAENVRRLEITYRDSAGVTDIELGCPPAGPGEGCTPGFWKQPQHFSSWTSPYDPDDAFATHFENAFPGKTLLQVLDLEGGMRHALGRHTVAALLNAASPDVNYAYSATQVIDLFNAVYPGSSSQYEALKNQFEAANERACPLPVQSSATRASAGGDPELAARSRGSGVTVLQRLLRARGYRRLKVTGYYNDATTQAVRRFQTRSDLKSTGICNDSTWRALRR